MRGFMLGIVGGIRKGLKPRAAESVRKKVPSLASDSPRNQPVPLTPIEAS